MSGKRTGRDHGATLRQLIGLRAIGERHGDRHLVDAAKPQTGRGTVVDMTTPAGAHRLAKLSVSSNAVVLGLVALAGCLCVAMPFYGDQALFTVYGRQLTRGSVLYRDVFDVKQPGIFVFYAFGGSLFGFTEVGIHLFELTYWLAFSLFTVVALRPYFTTRWGAPLVPVFTVVVYYLDAGLLALTQIEILVAFPILVAWWLIDQAEPGTHSGIRRYAAAGLAAAAVVLLKHLYVLVVLAFLVYAAVRSRRRGVPIRDIRRALGAFLIALLVPLLIVVAYFAAYGQLGRIWWAYFELSPTAQLTSESRALSSLFLGARGFLIGHGPILILAVLGCVDVFRKRARPKLDLVAGMMLWGALGAVGLFVQAWAVQKWLLFTVPLGILAVVGFEALVSMAGSLGKKPRPLALALALTATTVLGILIFLVGVSPQVQTLLLLSVLIGCCAGIALEFGSDRPRVRRRIQQVLSAALVVSVGLAVIVPVNKLHMLMQHDFALTVEARAELRRSWNESYRAADEDLEVLKSIEGVPGSLYVFGDPVLLLRANRPQAVPILGWGPWFYDSRAWGELDSELRSTLPSYIVMDGFTKSLIRSRYPAIIEFIESRYELAFVGASGTWYVLR
jgi:hypothetical protein